MSLDHWIDEKHRRRLQAEGMTHEEVLQVTLAYVIEEYTNASGLISVRGEALLAAVLRLLGISGAEMDR